jgi:RHS repeat-associated protein
MSRWIRSLFGRSLALLQIALLLSAGCSDGALAPTPGTAEYLAPGMIPVPGGLVNAAGGNLMIERTDLTLDSLVGGVLPIGAVYNSSLGDWIFSFQVRWDGVTLTDASGRSFDTSGLAGGSAIPGTHWVKVDSDTVQTRGGLAHDFDAGGRLAAVHWATLDHPRIRYTWSASALEIAQCTTAAACTGFYQIVFDASQRPVSVADVRGGRQAQYTWDPSGRLSVAKSPLEVAKGWPGTRYEYGLLGVLTALTTSEGERIEYAYQSGGRIFTVTQIGEGNPVHRFDFSAAGSDHIYRTHYTNPLGARTRLHFDPEYRLREIEFVETGERRSFTWSGLRPATVTLESGATTTYSYAGDDPVAIADAAGNTIQIAYQPGGLDQQSPRSRAIARIEDAMGLVEERSYDGSGRLIAVTNGEGESVDLTYHSTSLVASLTQPTGATLAFPLYGQHGHWLEMDGAASDKRSFDTTGNAKVESAKGRRGGVLNQQFDANRNLAVLNVAATDVSGVTGTGAITIERRSDGQILAVRRPYGGDHEFGYDTLGRLANQSERVDGQWRTTVFERDLAGNLTARTRPNGMREEWEYDGYGRAVAYRALRGQTLEGQAVYSYQDGQLASMFDSIRGTAEQYSYDVAGRLILTTYGYGETRSLEYDLRSRVTREALAVPGQVLFDIGFEHDLANRLIRTVDRAAQEVLVEHVVEVGQVAQIHYGNGLVREFSYDEAGLVVAAETRNATDEIVESTAIERTGETNPVRLQVRTATTTPLASTEEQYWLDYGELLSDPGKRVFAWTPGSGAPVHYAYDELSNQVSVPGGSTFAYNAERNRLLSKGSIAYTYDAAGFATSRGGVPITWTAAGRMASYGSSAAEWDLSGRLVELDFDGVARRFDLFGGRIESDASTGAVGALDLGEISLEPLSGDRSYRHFDFRGNVSFVTDGAGQVTDQHRYEPYGVDQSYGSGSNSNTFVGKPEAGPFLLLGARIYDPEIGRFLSSDPYLTVSNQYSYTSGNPIGFMDESGLAEIAQTRMTHAQRVAVAKLVGWAAATQLAIRSALASGQPTVVVLTVIAAVGAGVPIFIEAIGAFSAESLGTAPSDVNPHPGVLPPNPAPDPNPGGEQEKRLELEIQLTSHVLALTTAGLHAAPVGSCSPSTLANVGVDIRLATILLVLNLAFGLAWLRWRRRSVS